jgi:hypothetical protein
MSTPSLITQTTYAELLERCSSAAFGEAFPGDGVFTSKAIKGRRYWYFQYSVGEGRTQKYVGPETPELLEQIARHKEVRSDERERRALVSALARSFGLLKPIPEIGRVIEALANAGVFRLRGVLVGTMAYQTYSAMLGTKLPASILQTGDVDIAQFKTISVAIEDRTPPMLEILKEADKTFRPVPHGSDNRRVTSYAAKGGVRVDFLTPNEGKDTTVPQSLPAFQTDAQPFRYLDYLIRQPEAAVVLHNAGIYVQVPTPARYAVHKLIVTRLRPEGSAKRDKDLWQAEVLFGVLAEKRPYELKSAWQEAYERGQTWRKLMKESVLQITPIARDSLLKSIGWNRSEITDLDLTFSNAAPRFDFSRAVVIFSAEDSSGSVRCEISYEALSDYFGADSLNQENNIKRFQENKTVIEQIARMKYLSRPIEEPGVVLIRSSDVPKLKKSQL